MIVQCNDLILFYFSLLAFPPPPSRRPPCSTASGFSAMSVGRLLEADAVLAAVGQGEGGLRAVAAGPGETAKGTAGGLLHGR